MRTQAGHRRRRDDTWIMLSTACRPHSCPQSVGGRAATATRAVTAWRRLRWPTALPSGTPDSLTARRWCSPRRNGPLSCGGSRRATSAERIVWRLADNGRQRVWPGTFIIPDPLTPRVWRNGLLRGRLFGLTYFSWPTQGDAMVTTAGPVAGPVQSLPPVGTGSPTVLRILLGAQLRSLREAKRLSLEEAGNVIRASHSKISRLETGRVGFKDRDIVDLLTYYGVTDEKERETLRALAARANAPGWWHDYSDVLPNWLEPYVGLEEAASQIRTYEIQFVPGLLQTEDYARAVIMLAYSNPREINRRVGLRIARQSTLTRPDPPSLWAVLDEAALRRPIGGLAVMRRQLRHLIEMSQRPDVTIQILPFKSGGHAAVGAFSVLRFAEYDLPDVVYLEQLTSALYLDKLEVVDSYLAVMERLCIEAATPANSVKTMREIGR